MRLVSPLVLAMLGVAASLAACGGNGGGTGGAGITCDPGENIFCRCPGGEAGTKTCKSDGHSFEACVTPTGECPEVGDTTSSAGGSGGSSGGAGGTGGTGGTGGSGGGMLGKLYDPCFAGAECESGMCPYGYCTKTCAAFDECTLGVGECVLFMGNAICMPDCTLTSDCVDAYGEPSECGYASAIDGVPVTTCTDWGASLELPPVGSDCSNDVECNLGHDGKALVCEAMVCTAGCHVANDCPPNTTCNNQASPGTCDVAGDTCPGAAVSVSIGNDVMLTGDTSIAGAHYKGSGSCTTSASTNDIVYGVTPTANGTLTVTLDATYDGQLYARSGTCTTGTQIACSEAGGAGQAEVISFAVTSNTKYSVFADGKNGSSGSYTITFHLDP